MNKILKSVQAELAMGGFYNKKAVDQDNSEARYFAAHKNQLSYLFKTCQKHFRPGARFLDIGSACGYPCLGAKLIGYDAYGLDVRAQVENFSDRFANFQIENIACDLALEKTPFSNRKFDFILVSEVPEYVSNDPTRFFSEVTRLLKPGGVFIITAANLLRFHNLARNFLGRVPWPRDKNKQADYYCEFTATDMAYLLTKNGLNVEKIKYRNFNNQGIAWLTKLLTNLSGLFLPHRKVNLVVTARK